MRTLVTALLALTFAVPALAANTGIAWYGTWREGSAAARQSGKPILLVSAAVQCHGVSGIW